MLGILSLAPKQNQRPSYYQRAIQAKRSRFATRSSTKLNVRGQVVPGAFNVVSTETRSTYWWTVADTVMYGGNKKPTYQQFPESSGLKTFKTSSISDNGVSRQITSADTVKSLTASTLLSSKAIPKVRLFARLQDGIAKEWNRFILPKKSFPQQASGSISGASEHVRARESSEGAK